MEVAVINYRGLADAPLTTPRLFCADSWQDILEPMQHIHAKYVAPHLSRKTFAIGFSMGANILTNVLGYLGDGTPYGFKVDAACIVQAPI